MALRDKGFTAEAITAALSDIDADSELEAAKKIAVTRIRQLMKLDPDVRSRRLAGFLTRKGYSSSIVWAAVKHASSESSD
jgi:regulatory protein